MCMGGMKGTILGGNRPSEIKQDPKSTEFGVCPGGCGGTDIRVHFTKDDKGNETDKKDWLHWCVACGVGYNRYRPGGPFFDAMLFESCIKQMVVKK